MKKLVFLISLVILSVEGWSQTVSIKKTDGQIVNFNIDDIEYIELYDDVDNGKVEASIVGVWECTYLDFDKDYPGLHADAHLNIGDRVRFKSDGTYYANYSDGEYETGRWSLNGNTLTIAADVEISIPFEYNVTKLTSTELEFNIDLSIMKAYYRFKRVS